MSKDVLKKNGRLEVLRMGVGSFGNNVYLVRDCLQGCCALIDAAAEPESLLAAVGKDRLTAVLLTHAHPDHIQALEQVRLEGKAPLGVHPLEPKASGFRPEISLSGGQSLAVGSLELEVLHTPGHTPGSVCFLLRPDLCFCGDTVFPGGPGKTGSPEAFQQILKSLEQKIFVLPDHVFLWPGHGEGISVGNSRKEYEEFRSRPREKKPWGDVLWKES